MRKLGIIFLLTGAGVVAGGGRSKPTSISSLFDLILEAEDSTAPQAHDTTTEPQYEEELLLKPMLEKLWGKEYMMELEDLDSLDLDSLDLDSLDLLSVSLDEMLAMDLSELTESRRSMEALLELLSDDDSEVTEAEPGASKLKPKKRGQPKKKQKTKRGRSNSMLSYPSSVPDGGTDAGAGAGGEDPHHVW